MNTKPILRLALTALAFLLAHTGTAAPLSGTKSIGPTGDYASIGAAIVDIQAQTLGGALVLELQSAYLGNVETFPLVIASLGTTAANTVTLRPEAGATGLTLSSADTTAATVDLQGAQFLTIDGRPGGAGTVSQLSIANTHVAGVALRFINEASGNTVRYLALRGVNTSTNSGVVVFSTTTGANGNDDNTIDHCDIGDGASTPANGLYALGTTTTAAQNNSGNTVSSCNVFNFYAATALDAAGVRLDGGNTGWTLTGNSFYQTVSRAAVAAFVRPIFLNNRSGENFTVTGNFIGGSAASAGGSAWTTTGTASSYRFVGLQLNVSNSAPSSVQGNTIQNIVWTSSSGGIPLPGGWNGIYVQAGAVNIGTEAGNTVGSSTGTDSISVTSGAANRSAYGIVSASPGTVVIANNGIGSITVNGASTSISASLFGINVTAGTNTISGNTVGSTTTANSLNAATSATAGSQKVTGISASSGAASITRITGNTVANLNNNFVGTSGGAVHGIAAGTGVNTITGNTVRNLSTTSRYADAFVHSVIGISHASESPGQTVSQNVVHSLANTAASGDVWVTGIYFYGTTSSSNVIARNLVHSLAVSSTSTSSVVNGMMFEVGDFTAQNNMVRVGLDAAGTSTAGASIVRGIYDFREDSGRNFYHNSVYVGGTQTSGATNTFAFTSTGTVNVRACQNNLFVNARSNSGGTGKHYAVNYGGTNVNPAGLKTGGNIFHVSGTGGVLGRYNGADRATLAAWQVATGQDVTSAAVDPLFVNATGDATTVDLHLQPSNPAEGNGLALAAVSDDFDGQTRSTLTPADIGADAGNFTLTGDFFAPVLSYPLLTSGTVGNRTLTDFATITDNVGVASGASAPRFYYKKSTDADVFAGNTAAANGWKFVSAANGSSPFSFTIDYSLLNGGGVTIGNTIQYFVVAQDAANNLRSVPFGAAAAANPPVPNVNVKPSAGVNSYSIFPTLSGTKTVGTGGDYPSLTRPGGLFAAINGSVVTGHLVINITSDLTETGLNGLNQWLEEGAGNYTLTIQPGSATMKTISGTSTNGLIRLNGADRVTIDGRFGGTGRYLTLHNLSDGPSASTLLLLNDACHNTVRSCLVNGHAQGYELGVIGFSTGAVTGNDHNLITDNQVSSPGASFALTLIGSTGTSPAVANSSNTISNNELFNFNGIGVFADSGSDSWTVSGNNIYEVTTQTFSIRGIYMQATGTNVITANSIHDLLTTSGDAVGIVCNWIGTTTISRNRITGVNVIEAASITRGIFAAGSPGSTVNVVNNQITLISATTVNASFYGLVDQGQPGSVCNVFYNTIVIGGTASGGSNSWVSLRSGASTHTSRNNLFLNFRTGGTGRYFAAGREASGGSYTANDNVYAGTGAGATPGSFMDFNAGSATPVPVNFATWQASTGGDANSQAGNPGGNFSTNMFVDAEIGDLHLVPGGNPLVNGTGNPIAGITTDYDGELRHATTPNIGSDEPAAAGGPDIAVAQTSALTDGVSSVDFGPVTVASSSAARTFTITNTGTADLTSLAISTDGANSGDFTFNALGSTTLTPGSTTTFNVTFTPSGVGPRNAALHLANNVSGAKNPFDIALTGTGLSANSAPTVSNAIPAQAGAYGAAFQFTFAADVFTDPDAGQSLTYTATNQPPGVGFDAATRTFSGTNGAAGVFLVSVIATDDGVPPRSATNTFALTVAKAPLTITANNTNRPYGEANPAFTGTLTGLLNLDNITATFGTPATPASAPGTYPIAPALADPDSRLGHYTVTTNLGTLTIQEVRIESSLAGTTATLSWPIGAANLLLECTASLEPPVTWQPVTIGIIASPTNLSYTVLPVTVPPARFYRLRLP